jgi:hypothetical protein
MIWKELLRSFLENGAFPAPSKTFKNENFFQGAALKMEFLRGCVGGGIAQEYEGYGKYFRRQIELPADYPGIKVHHPAASQTNVRCLQHNVGAHYAAVYDAGIGAVKFSLPRDVSIGTDNQNRRGVKAAGGGQIDFAEALFALDHQDFVGLAVSCRWGQPGRGKKNGKFF